METFTLSATSIIVKMRVETMLLSEEGRIYRYVVLPC